MIMGNLKIGIFGVRRGMNLAKDFMLNGCDKINIRECHQQTNE